MDYTKISSSDLLKWLQENLCEERYIHSLGTAECARDLAEKFGENSEKAYVAGLLHDCAKCFSNEKLLEIIDQNLEIEEVERMNPKTLHAPVSAYVAEQEFGVDDEELLSAIRWHTLGKLDMTNFEKIIFLADKVEPRTRCNKCLDEIRACLNETDGLNKAMLKCYKETIKSLVNRDLKICPVTIDIYNYLEDLINVN
ncbi:HD domain-containing protein [bacterium]|nr:HD domain-containing protein [bacterium]